MTSTEWTKYNHNTHITQYLKNLVNEYNMRNICLEESYPKCGREVTPRLFYKKTKLSISLDR